jgi:L-ascorbate metabolism protein UlaG (beta-lactamase superfamily)
MKYLIRIAAVLLLLIVAAASYIYHGLSNRPDIDAFNAFKTFSKANRDPGLRVTFLGVSTLLLDDGETAILTDGFFTRPNSRQLFLEKIAPDTALIAKTLQRAGITKLAAVIVNHSHYDHAMDSPEVAARTGAILVGSESTANVGRGWGLPDGQIAVHRAGDLMTFGRFRITLLPGRHVPSPFTGGEITEPLKPPVRANAYLEGGSFMILVEHGDRRMLINASAGFVPGALNGRKADVVFMGTGQLGKRPISYMEDYWREVVERPGARRVIPIHWDDFTRPLDQPLVPLPNLLDDFAASMEFLNERGRTSGIDIKLPEAFVAFDPFENLPANN